MGFIMFVLVDGVGSMRRKWTMMVSSDGFQIGRWEYVQVTRISEV